MIKKKEFLKLGILSVRRIISNFKRYVQIEGYRYNGCKIGPHVSLGYGSSIYSPNYNNIKIGDFVRIGSYTIISLDKLKIGNATTIGNFVSIFTGNINIGENVYIEKYVSIDGRGGVIIEDNVEIGAGTRITTHDASYSCVFQGYPITEEPVKLCKNSWIGTSVVILPGITVGERAVVGAGAVVTKDIPPKTVVVGIPARPIKMVLDVKNMIKSELLDREKLLLTSIESFKKSLLNFGDLLKNDLVQEFDKSFVLSGTKKPLKGLYGFVFINNLKDATLNKILNLTKSFNSTLVVSKMEISEQAIILIEQNMNNVILYDLEKLRKTNSLNDFSILFERHLLSVNKIKFVAI